MALPSTSGSHGYYIDGTFDGSALSGDIADANCVIRLTDSQQIPIGDISSGNYNIYDENGELDFNEIDYSEGGTYLDSLVAHVHQPIKQSPSGEQNKFRIFFGDTPGDQSNAGSAYTSNTQNAWEMNEASGNVLDPIASATFTAANAPGSATGKVGNCRSFVKASSQYFYRASYTVPTTGSLSAWANSDSAWGSVFALIFSNTDMDYYPGFWLGAWSNGNQYGGWVLNAGNDDRAAWTISGMSTNTWYRWTMTWTNGGLVRIYLDSVLKATATDTTLDATYATGSYSTRIGHLNVTGPGAVSHWNGEIDHILMRTNAMSADERVWDYRNGGGVADYEQSYGTIQTVGDGGNPWYYYAQMQ